MVALDGFAPLQGGVPIVDSTLIQRRQSAKVFFSA
jgi:hypothetical protein